MPYSRVWEMTRAAFPRARALIPHSVARLSLSLPCRPTLAREGVMGTRPRVGALHLCLFACPRTCVFLLGEPQPGRCCPGLDPKLCS